MRPNTSAPPLTPISALSPLDGRYVGKLTALRPFMSEQGYMHRRVQVEVEWFIALSEAGFAEFRPLSEAFAEARRHLAAYRAEAKAAAERADDVAQNHCRQHRGCLRRIRCAHTQTHRIHREIHQPKPQNAAHSARQCHLNHRTRIFQGNAVCQTVK